MLKKINIAQISLNIVAPIPRKDTNPFQRICPPENLIIVTPHITHI